MDFTRTLITALVLAGSFVGLQAQSYTNAIPYPDAYDAPFPDSLEIDVDETFHNFDPDSTMLDSNGKYFNNVPTFGYNIHGQSDNSWLGPTLVWHHGEPMNINVYNNLNINNIPTTVHWHGAHIPAKWDGGPHQVIENGDVWRPRIDTVRDDVCTLWYHPHMEDSTFKQVEMGISGIIDVQDANDPLVNNNLVPHTYKVDDLPLIIQDRAFIKNPTADSITSPYLINQGKNSGPIRIVNGVMNPFAEVGKQVVRFRVLNGSSRQAMYLGIKNKSTQANVKFWLIASDAGYLDDPIEVEKFETGPGIRNEFLVDFSNAGGETFELYNYADTLQELWGGRRSVVLNNGNQNAVKEKVMEIKVDTVARGSNPVTTIPSASDFPNYPKFDPNDVSKTRWVYLDGERGGSGIPYNINGEQFVLHRVNDTIEFNATERWNVKNTSDVAHPFHIHDVHVDVVNVMDTNGTIAPADWPAYLVGRQDNFLVPAGWQVDFITKFDDFGDTLWVGDPVKTAENGYMYHCHILTHEDGYYRANGLDAHGMMQQFLVRKVTSPPVGLPGEAEDNPVVFYPNPVEDILHIYGESKRASELCIFDLAGKMIMRQELIPFEGEKSFDLNHITNGMYLVEWRDLKGRSVTKKIVLQH